jgi:FkbM family methyltransferase
MEAARALQRWEFFQRLRRARSIRPLVIGEHEFRVGCDDLQSDQGRVEMALRVPFCDSSDTDVFDQVFIRQEYRQALEWFSSVCPGETISTILDVGANIGCTALFLSIQFPSASIFCLEPEASNYARLQLNIGLNHQKKIRCFRGALSTQPGRLKLSRDFGDGKEWASRFVEDVANATAAENHESAEAVEIWGLLEKTGFATVDFLKMDIEGAEANLLRDSRFREFLKEKVRRVAIEVHETFMETAEAIDVLKSLNFKTHTVTEFVCGIKLPMGI